MDYAIFVKEVQGKRLIDVIFKKRAKPKEGQNRATAGYDAIVQAREARLRLDPEQNLMMVDMQNVHVAGDQGTTGKSIIERRTCRFPNRFSVRIPGTGRPL